MPEHFMVLIHVIAAIILIGPVMVATSQFPKAAQAAHNGDELARGRAQSLHSITKAYGLWSLLVPLIGFGALFTVDGALKNYFIHTGILLTVIGWGILFFVIVPKQRTLIADLNLLDEADDIEPDEVPPAQWDKTPGMLNMFSGIFNALWVITAILMFFRP
ncbi:MULTISPECIES: hypothetical protein [Corynebacterium]|uniref:DUF2269 domain-containing protein n=2 Tax=Corynebacterium TaxID=1716 RepID=A0AAU0PVL9_9CORY|nr:MULTISPECIES: hypothetical protein [Corynebacterium]MCF6778476.1 DUF2269 domain-containing protein [Corynebacterium parakroppenstedtii]MCZ9302691.1 DUF2269 domain-containing protein [Corynebacterium sp. c24U_166]ACR18053.1 putative membrane protein [Corynebacterium kroppenstedtii DSM 44385]MCF6784433.1 DUF2269 domain-containing protein [Corynebacterium parakroppenstedtii]MCF6788525.1 DUF2269 domain-containing protein [Corynebacterium parakroppenstedtii]